MQGAQFGKEENGHHDCESAHPEGSPQAVGLVFSVEVEEDDVKYVGDEKGAQSHDEEVFFSFGYHGEGDVAAGGEDHGHHQEPAVFALQGGEGPGPEGEGRQGFDEPVGGEGYFDHQAEVKEGE